jgi:hypothetical protein
MTSKLVILINQATTGWQQTYWIECFGYANWWEMKSASGSGADRRSSEVLHITQCRQVIRPQIQAKFRNVVLDQ